MIVKSKKELSNKLLKRVRDEYNILFYRRSIKPIVIHQRTIHKHTNGSIVRYTHKVIHRQKNTQHFAKKNKDDTEKKYFNKYKLRRSKQIQITIILFLYKISSIPYF